MLPCTTSLFFCLVMGWSLLAQSAAYGKTAAYPKTQHGTHVGIASVYGKKFSGRKTASGTTFKPDDLTAASRRLPLNSKAKVTNLKTGQSTEVTINDRGPYAKGRVIDLSPAAAERIGLDQKEGVAPVEVKPISPAAPNASVAETPSP